MVAMPKWIKPAWEMYKSAGAWGEVGTGVAVAGTYLHNHAHPNNKKRYADAAVAGGIIGTTGALAAKMISMKMARGVRF